MWGIRLLLLCLLSQSSFGQNVSSPVVTPTNTSVPVDPDIGEIINNVTMTLSPQIARLLEQLIPLMPQLQAPIRQAFASIQNGTGQGQMINVNNYVTAITDVMSLLQKGGMANLGQALTVLQQAGILNPGAVANLQNLTSVNPLDLLNSGGSKCYIDLATYVTSLGQGLGQFWALEMLDASAKPGPSILKGNYKFFGNYKQCAAVRQTNNQLSYLLSDVEGSMFRFYWSFQLAPGIGFGRDFRSQFAPPLYWDLCLPKSCTGLELFEALQNNGVTQIVWVGETVDMDLTDDTDAIAAIFVLSVFGCLVLAGTVMDVYVRSLKADAEKKNKSLPTSDQGLNGQVVNGKANGDVANGNGYVNGGYSHDGSVPVTEKDVVLTVNTTPLPASEIQFQVVKEPVKVEVHLSTWQKVLLAFSLPANTDRLLNCRVTKGNIGCLHGIRVLSLAWVILGHVLSGYGINHVINKLDSFDNMTHFTFQVIVNGTLSVDTFFVMSGFLTAYLFLKSAAKRKGVDAKTMVMYYVHRYWRLTPPLMLWIMFTACLVSYVFEGRPGFGGYPQSQPCKDTWWHNLLYINSVTDKGLACEGQTWYLADDMMFYIQAPLALIPWAYGYTYLGVGYVSLLIVLHLSTNFWLIADYNFDMLRNNVQFMDKLYFKPYARCAPYAIGLLLGYVMHRCKGKVRMGKCVAAFGWIAAIGLALLITLVTYDENGSGEKIAVGWPMGGKLVHETLSRPLWALVVAWIIMACASGHGGFIDSILSWEGWLPMSKLSFGAYLVHLTIINLETQAAEYISLFTWDIMIYKFLGFYIIAYAVAYILAVVVEVPMQGLEKALLH